MCDDLERILDYSDTELKTSKSKIFRAILRTIKKNIAYLLQQGLNVHLTHVNDHQNDVKTFY